ncbi:uncharacterized protein [Littorina saxatilis]|uniref:uncharacterized protein isoform X2 n=1 Tax=Littorina saxatilis TaxID=31220 RepID=UPI0038B54408
MADADTRGERRSRYITTDTVEPGGRGQRFKTREYFPHFSYGQRMVQAALAKSLPAIPLPDDTSNHPVDCSFEPQALVTEDSTSSHHSVDSQMDFSDKDMTYVPDSASSIDGSHLYPPLFFGSQLITKMATGTESTCPAPAEPACPESTSCPKEDPCRIKGLSFAETKTVGDKTVPKPKQHFCLFCQKPQSRLPRHIETQHKDEKSMVPYLNAKKGSGEKKAELTKLRNAGDHQHNLSVLRNVSGTLVVKRRKRESPSVSNFVACPYCLGYFQIKDIYRHKCVEANDGSRREFVKKGKLMLPDSECKEDESEAFQSFLDTLQSDHIRLVVKTDPLIKELARSQVKRHGFNPSRFAQIRNKVREVSRLLLKLRKVSGLENASLKEFLTPEMFKTVIEATKQVAGYEAEEYKFRIPSLANKLGYTIKLCADILEVQAVEKRNDSLKCDVQGYLKLHQMRWNEEISAHASRNLYEQKKGHAKRLPLSRDVAKLSSHLSNVSAAATQTLTTAHEEKEIKAAWKSLAEVTLTQIILFNRRRSGEASRMKLVDLNQHETHDVDVFKSLSTFEKILCNKLTRIEIIGKRGRIVPILMTAQVKAAVELLVQKRDDAGVSGSNKFVFSCTFFQSEGHIRGSDTLRKFVTSAQLAEPQFITSTSLRKQVATLSQIVSLKDNELDALAQFMGHDVRTHREYYRLPSDMMQLAKVSKLLLALEKGKLQDHQRCTLDEMEVAEDEAITSDEEAEFVEKGHSPIPERSASGRFATKDSLAPPHNQPSPPMHQPCPATAAPDSEPPSSWTFSPVGVAMMNKRCSVFTQITSPSASSNESSTDNEYLPEQWSHSKPKKLKSKATRNSSSQPRRLWLEEEVKAVEAHLLKYIATQVLPRKEDIQKCLQAEEALKNRTWLHVKNYVRNRITALQRNQRN